MWKLPIYVELINGHCPDVWANEGKIPVTPTKWTSYAELVQVWWEMWTTAFMMSLRL
jgi:hypothetical protein